MIPDDKRRLIAALACRNTGSRLYGKPLQRINETDTILDQIIKSIKNQPEIAGIVLGISEGLANLPFIEVAHTHETAYILGDPEDVLFRLIQCGRAGRATDVFRVTTECPWSAYELLAPMWRHHLRSGNDITVCDGLPEGLHFEIYKLDALELAHARGSRGDRSEFCSNYPRTHPEEFKTTVFLPQAGHRRLDLRVTVDNPEDLVIVREIARACADAMPCVPVDRIIRFLDSRPDLKALVQPFVVEAPLWPMFSDQRDLSTHA